jgi:hypothetical protein
VLKSLIGVSNLLAQKRQHLLAALVRAAEQR